ncbi:uncharacterized protein [Pyrus communis]|uniref:uncharacterized protein n=1 Tax=Pyrus communis TaxID=23211 RepID=UPI0035BEFDD5
MQISLSAKNKLGFITGDVQEASSSDDPDAHAAWRRCNDMILSWLLHSLEPDLQESVLFTTTAQDVLDDLHERFLQSNAPHIFQLNCELATISQGSSSVSAYFTRLKFLMGIHDSFSAIRDQILLMNPLLTVRQACSSVSQAEKQRSLGSVHPIDSLAAMAVCDSFRLSSDTSAPLYLLRLRFSYS